MDEKATFLSDALTAPGNCRIFRTSLIRR